MRIVDIATQRTIIEGVPGRMVFSPDERYVAYMVYDQAAQMNTAQIIDTEDSRVLFEVPGENPVFSPDGQLLAIFYAGDMTTVIHEVPSGRMVKQIPATGNLEVSPSSILSANYKFTPDGRTLALYQYFDLTTHLIDVSTWEVMYTVNGFIEFNRDGDYFTVRHTDGASSPMELLETATGEVLYEVTGSMSFSPDGKLAYLYEFDSYEDKTVRVVELSTGNILTEQRGWIVLQLVDDNRLVEIHDGSTNTTHYVEIETGVTRWEVAGSAWMFDDVRHLALVDESRIVDVSTGDVLAADQRITLSADGRYAFTSNGVLTDLYGAPEARTDAMPAPRPGSGIAQAPAGELSIYEASPDEPGYALQTEQNPFKLYVMGQSPDGDWLYVVYNNFGGEISHIIGWVHREGLEVIESWDDVPVLSFETPLQDLKAGS